MSKKVIYLVTSAACILAAGIVKMNDESNTFEPSLHADEVEDLKSIWEENFPGKKVPASLSLQEEDALSLGIEYNAYDLNNGEHFHKIMRVLNGDANEIKELSTIGQVIIDAVNHHKKLRAILPNVEQDELEDDPDYTDLSRFSSEGYGVDPAEPAAEIVSPVDPPVDEPEVFPQTADVPAHTKIQEQPVVEPAAAPVIEVPAESVIEPAIADSETNTVNSETETAKEETADKVENSEDADKKTAKKK